MHEKYLVVYTFIIRIEYCSPYFYVQEVLTAFPLFHLMVHSKNDFGNHHQQQPKIVEA